MKINQRHKPHECQEMPEIRMPENKIIERKDLSRRWARGPFSSWMHASHARLKVAFYETKIEM